MEFANKVAFFWFDKTLRLVHVNIFIKNIIEKGRLYVELVDWPI